MKRKMWKRLASLALATVLTVGLVPGAQAVEVDLNGGELELSSSTTYSGGRYHVTYEANLTISDEMVAIVNANNQDSDKLKNLLFTCYLEDDLLANGLTQSQLSSATLTINTQSGGAAIFQEVSGGRAKTSKGASVTYELTDSVVDSLAAANEAVEVKNILQTAMSMTISATLTEDDVWDAIGSADSVSTEGYILLTYEDGNTIPGFNKTELCLAQDTSEMTISPTASGGSSGGGSSRPTYPIEAVDTPNGEVKTTPTRASKGTLVTITVTPDTGYEVASLSVVDEDGNEVEVEDKGNGKYTFTMPASEVSVNVTFAEIVDDMPFVDVAENDWFYDSVRYVYDNGLMEGTSATTFAPTLTTTRSMVATILWRVEGEAQVDHIMSYPDVEPNTWYTEAVRWATAEGIMEGYGDGRFGPNDSITREQLATILYRYAKYKGYDVSASNDLSAFVDADQTGDWAVDAVKWAVGSGLLNGKDGGRLDPQGVASRAEVATMLMRFMENIAE